MSLDDEKHYGITDPIEKYVTRPEIFRAFGWHVEHVLGWFRPEIRLLNRIEGYFDDAPGKGKPVLRVVE